MVRRLFSKIGWGKFLLLWGFSLAFGLSCRTNQKTTLLVHLLTVLNDQYYFIFAVLPILLFFCGRQRGTKCKPVLIRLGAPFSQRMGGRHMVSFARQYIPSVGADFPWSLYCIYLRSVLSLGRILPNWIADLMAGAFSFPLL